MKCSKLRRLLGLRRPRRGAYDAPPYPLVVRGFLPSAIAASRLRLSQFPPLRHSTRSPQLLDRGCAPASRTIALQHNCICAIEACAFLNFGISNAVVLENAAALHVYSL